MFIEPNIRNNRYHQGQDRRGWIEVVCGSMFSGKTEELIRRLKRAQIANLKVEIFKPTDDVRYDEYDIVSHNENRIQSTPVENSQQILLLCQDVDVVGIDEAQFFDSEMPQVAETLAGKGIRVIVAGLDMDFLGRPFGPMPQVLAMADYVTKLHAICMVCGDIANFSYRKTVSDVTVLLGEKDVYEPRCRSCYSSNE
ncbi:MAG: thymidine kinase [Chitinophagaceae bacterium]|nr:thymidine kinase [Chitinophagaceae bacterium]